MPAIIIHWKSRNFGIVAIVKAFGTVDSSGVDILGVDIVGVSFWEQT